MGREWGAWGGEEGGWRNPKTRDTETETLQTNGMPRLSKDLNCHGCGSLDHQKDKCPRVDRGIRKPAAEKKKVTAVRCKVPHLTTVQSRILEQLALVQLKQELVGMTEQPGDQRLLESIRVGMVKWNAVAVPAIANHQLDSSLFLTCDPPAKAYLLSCSLGLGGVALRRLFVFKILSSLSCHDDMHETMHEIIIVPPTCVTVDRWRLRDVVALTTAWRWRAPCGGASAVRALSIAAACVFIKLITSKANSSCRTENGSATWECVWPTS